MDVFLERLETYIKTHKWKSMLTLFLIPLWCSIFLSAGVIGLSVLLWIKIEAQSFDTGISMFQWTFVWCIITLASLLSSKWKEIAQWGTRDQKIMHFVSQNDGKFSKTVLQEKLLEELNINEPTGNNLWNLMTITWKWVSPLRFTKDCTPWWKTWIYNGQERTILEPFLEDRGWKIYLTRAWKKYLNTESENQRSEKKSVEENKA